MYTINVVLIIIVTQLINSQFIKLVLYYYFFLFNTLIKHFKIHKNVIT